MRRIIYHCDNCHRDWTFKVIEQTAGICPICGITVALKKGKNNDRPRKNKENRSGKILKQTS